MPARNIAAKTNGGKPVPADRLCDPILEFESLTATNLPVLDSILAPRSAVHDVPRTRRRAARRRPSACRAMGDEEAAAVPSPGVESIFLTGASLFKSRTLC